MSTVPARLPETADSDDDLVGLVADEVSEGDDPGETRANDWLIREPGVDYGDHAHLHADGSPRVVLRQVVVEPEVAGLRLDHFIKLKIPRMSRTRIQLLIEQQLTRGTTADIDVPGRKIKSNTTVATGDVFTIRRLARAEPPCPRTFSVLHSDDDLLVLDKPAGLPMHSSAKFYFNTLTRVMSERYPDRDPQICHRLDRETSGALVAAWNKPAAAIVKTAFAAKRVSKTYLAIVQGHPPWPDERDSGADDYVIDVPLRVARAGDPTKLLGVRMFPGPGGLPSITRVRVVERAGPYSLIRCTPVTGRQHQIRVHLADAGFPIIGDKLYAYGDAEFLDACDGKWSQELRDKFILPRHALHAASVEVPHPTRGGRLRIDSPLAPDLERFLAAHRGT